MSNQRSSASTFRSRAWRATGRAGIAMAVGTLVLTGCASDDAEYEQFCDTSRSLSELAAQLETLVPDPETLTAARDGDFAALNSWGADAEVTVTTVGDEFQEALDAAPDEEVGTALESYLAMLDVFQQMAIASATADNVDDFAATLDDLNQQTADLADSITEAGNTLSTTEQVHCK
ncbi:hypothetical protein [Demequina aurantiaca]|uniref:hypothetical protein n=1 Tax=Demequina aurantiaca TaxID=676200 RepID=UPI003D337630